MEEEISHNIQPTSAGARQGPSLDLTIFDLLHVAGAAIIWPDFWITNDILYWGHES